MLLSDSIFAKALNSVLEMPILLGSSQPSVAMREAFTQWTDKVSSKHRFAPSLVEELAVEAFGRQTLCKNRYVTIRVHVVRVPFLHD